MLPSQGPIPVGSTRNTKSIPNLLRELKIDRPNQVWATDITYIPMARGFLYLAAILDWYSRFVLAWRLSNTLDTHFCVEALEAALSVTQPEIFNTDQGTPVYQFVVHRHIGGPQNSH